MPYPVGNRGYEREFHTIDSAIGRTPLEFLQRHIKVPHVDQLLRATPDRLSFLLRHPDLNTQRYAEETVSKIRERVLAFVNPLDEKTSKAIADADEYESAGDQERFKKQLLRAQRYVERAVDLTASWGKHDSAMEITLLEIRLRLLGSEVAFRLGGIDGGTSGRENIARGKVHLSRAEQLTRFSQGLGPRS